jgi:hypothetical protein
MATHCETPSYPAVLSPEEGRALFDQQVRLSANMSGDEFLERWDKGEFQPLPDTPAGRAIGYLALLSPFGRKDS